MCKHCDVRMPDASGMEMDGEHHLMQILIADGGCASVRGEGWFAPGVQDTFKFNYCPICGQPLGDTPEDENTIYFVQDFNYDDGYYPAYLDKEDAIDHAEGVIGSDDTRECSVLTARVIKKDTCKLAITWD